jgi:dipeptidyl aminopeptidase/acylaminoacyl peptidase
MKRLAMLLGLLVLSPALAPATDVFLAPILSPGSARAIGPWTNISANAGYDNQPAFLPGGAALYFASNRDGKQTDIYRYDITTRTLTQMTRTAESEYSPTVTPDGRTFSVIQVEADGAQRLWRFDPDGGNPRVVLADVKPVGYHAWIDETRLALFVLGATGPPHALQLASSADGTSSVVASGIGRSILVRPGLGTVSFMTTAPRMMRELNPKTGAMTDIVAPPDGSQDAAWLPDGRLLMARGTTILVWSAGADGWAPFADLAALGTTDGGASPAVSSITRMAVSPDGRWLAFVAEPRVP